MNQRLSKALFLSNVIQELFQTLRQSCGRKHANEWVAELSFNIHGVLQSIALTIAGNQPVGHDRTHLIARPSDGRTLNIGIEPRWVMTI
jgi:hypothetical protein|tara:strand:+ start:2949 stop:3215 length:267 start_codon:yes stop_codon:yes gene_type:complete